MTDATIQQAPVAEARGIPLEYILSNGIRRPTPEFVAAFTATTIGGGGDVERYRQLVRDALTILESMDYETLCETFTGIRDKARALECRQCFGMGEIRSAGLFVGTCPSCDGTGLK